MSPVSLYFLTKLSRLFDINVPYNKMLNKSLMLGLVASFESIFPIL